MDRNNKIISLFLLAIYVYILLPISPALAQELNLPSGSDHTPPVIQHQEPGESVPTGKPFIIEVTVTDDVAVKDVLLYYRPMGNMEYYDVNMDPSGNNRYKATIPAADVLDPGIEYYIQASDKAGNMVMRGFSFSPLTVMVAPVMTPSAPVVTAPPKPELKPAVTNTEPAPAVEPRPTDRVTLRTAPQAEKAWYQKWWVWTIGGGVIAGMAIAMSGGPGPDEGGPPPSAGAPTMGSVTISGPLP